MKVSLHRRRHESLPPTPRRSPRILIVALVLGSAGVGLAAANLGDGDALGPAPPFDPAVAAAEQASHDVVDERVRAHLRKLR
jgi:hypothetical protein